jgi:CheY-like chemotaxis protein
MMKKTVLLVEDTPDALELMKLRLKTLGHQIIVASDWSEAVQIVQTNDFDLVLINGHCEPADKRARWTADDQLPKE